MFELVQVAENTFYIDCPVKMGIYRQPDNKVILIDSGNDKDAGRKILKIIKENNWTLETIINTHSNADHIGGNKFLSDRTECKIYAKGIEKAFCEFPVLEPAFLFGGFPNKHLRNKFLLAEPSRVENIAEFTPPENMEIFPLKGHFFDMIGVKTPDDVYFMADCVSSEAILKKYHISFIYDLAEYLKTLDAIETLDGEIFIPAHADAVKTMKPLAHINRQKIFEIIDGIKQICGQPSSFESILKKIFDKYSLIMDMSQYVLVGSTIKSYLSYLVDNNILKIEIQDNNLLWRIM
jgi:glyoxylase-like metal-dependent hydrolase (beta-lactamase superfamily II)